MKQYVHCNVQSGRKTQIEQMFRISKNQAHMKELKE